LLRLARPDDATHQIKILNEFLCLRGAVKVVLHDAKLLQRVGYGECAIWNFMDY